MEELENSERRFNPDSEKRPWQAVTGLLLGILGWIAIFALPKAESTSVLYTEMYALLAVSAIAGLLCWFGIKRASGMAIVGIVVAVFLFLTLICGLIGFAID